VRSGAGQKAPSTVADLLATLKRVRSSGVSCNANSFLDGMAAMAVVIRHPDTQAPMGTVSIAGPSVRFSVERMKELTPALVQAAQELSEASRASLFFSRHKELALRS
jgi:IclR family acetate operon transcriptional repressor